MRRDQRASRKAVGTNRRSLLAGTAAAAVLGASGLGSEAAAHEAAEPGASVKNGRIKQSIVHWCFEKYWPIEEFIKTAKGLGVGSIELLPAKYFPALKEAGITNAIGQIDMGADPPFVKGF